jgi:hypothetical protein
MKFIFLYALGVYLIFICTGIHLNSAHGGGLPAQTDGFPSIRSTEYPKHIEPAKSCGQYLTVCEKSCSNRGDLFRFLCLGQGFNPESQRYRCQCGDDAFQQQVVKTVDQLDQTIDKRGSVK